KDIWPRINEINIPLDSFPIVKNLRNLANANNAFPYSVKHGSNNNSISVVGSPDLGRIKTFMLGIRNPKIVSSTVPDDDGLNKCGEVWFNELRLEGFDERGGSAALARVDLKLADLGNMSVSGNMHTIGFGGIEQSVSERYRDNFYQYDASSSIDIGKLTPRFIGLNLPFFASISESFSNPQYDPYDSDIELKDKLLLIENDPDLSTEAKKESIKATRDAAQSYTGNKSLNFSNIRFSGRKGKADSKKKKTKKKRFYDPKNFNLSYSFIETEKRDPIIKSDKVKTYNGNLGYSFSHRPKSYKPFNKLLKTKWKYLKPIKDFNFTLMPSNLTFQSGMNRQFGELQLRSIGDEIAIEPTYNKFFDWSRKYDLKYKPAKSINLNFNANANARIDEPEGKIDEEWEKDSIIYNIMNMGRILSYDHKASANYKLPLNKLPLTNWININLKYNTGYKWNASSLVMQSWGNIIQNNNTKQINASLNTRTLYNNFKKLNKQLDKLMKPDKDKKDKKKDKLDEDNKEKEESNKKIRDKERIQDIRKKKKKKKQTIGGKIFEKLITGVKTFSVNYTENEGTTLPGFMPSPEVAGQSLKYSAPGPAFIFGYQPNDQWLEGIANMPGILTTDTLMNHQLLRNKSFNLNARAAVEPIKGFRIDLSMKSDFSISNTEFFKDTIGDGNQYVHLNPVSNGNMKVSFIAWNTIFDSEDANGISETFKTFEKNRKIISERLSYANPSSGLTPHDTLPGYYNGYGSTSQDVLIPAFMAAYTGQNVNEININSPIRQKPLPLPNWRIRYSGLSKIKALKKIFKSITISHSYSSTFSIN
ncbi:MAG TPA: cell surface protein SprA, partial [Bacteroidetes bacterium]|nr:cell surface protein SprA [Bacteroidota bacterium]